MSLALGVATGGEARGDDGLRGDLKAAELVIPDLRVEFGDRATSIVLAFPLVVDLAYSNHVVIDLWIEPQYRDVDHEIRGLVGGRVTLGPLTTPRDFRKENAGAGGIFVEIGGVAGTDGAGFMIGGGFSLLHSAWGSACSLVYRTTYAGGNTRHDISLDLLRIVLN